MALKWHPDRWSKDPKFALEAKKRFQHIQEAYSGALSGQIERLEEKEIYDAGLFGLIGEDDDEVGFINGLDDAEYEKGTLEDLQGLLMDMMEDNEEIGMFPSSRVEWDNAQPLMELVATRNPSDLVKSSCLPTEKRKSIRIKTTDLTFGYWTPTFQPCSSKSSS
ncbi:unnamed protein product [Sphenostylis stenocarpa]|uniref:J domain-containing protein n=1 Tax=Sphenostylis stenocarpa TaxID=92480 RepID=A0AA86V6V0_9FABA|nr:unnamed protein product [Sphenostylis stenocarpa]